MSQYKRTALVLGAGGFIGSHMVKRLRADGYWVRGVDLKYPEFTSTQAHEFVQGDSEKVIRPGEYCFIPKGQIHRLSAGDEGVMFIEVQQGICEEEDIVRLSDDYGRS